MSEININPYFHDDGDARSTLTCASIFEVQGLPKDEARLNLLHHYLLLNGKPLVFYQLKGS